MSKKNFKNALSENNPALNFISGATVELEDTEKTPAGEVETTTTQGTDAENKKTASETAQTDTNKKAKLEAIRKANFKEKKCKRFNLLMQPSLHKDLSNLAILEYESLNNLIIKVLTSYRDNNKDKLELLED